MGGNSRRFSSRLSLTTAVITAAVGLTAMLAVAAENAPPGASSGFKLIADTLPAPPKSEPPSVSSSSTTKLPPGYVDNSTCTKCHEVQTQNFKKSIMGHVLGARPRDEVEALGCQACHGPGREHVRHPHKPAPGFVSFASTQIGDVKLQNDRCLQCHQNGERAFWKASTHAFRSVRCADCHQAMCPVTITEEPNPQIRKSPLSTSWVTPYVVTRPETQICFKCHLDKKMQINLPSHMPVKEGLMTCTDCHNPHGGPYPNQLKAATITQVCYRCHAEKRGPFLWIHPPAMMDCINCHTPHGSVNQHMLTIREPLLCQRCHISTRHPSTPQKPTAVYVINQSCTNCHTQIHGSNSPGGRVFTR